MTEPLGSAGLGLPTGHEEASGPAGSGLPTGHEETLGSAGSGLFILCCEPLVLAGYIPTLLAGGSSGAIKSQLVLDPSTDKREAQVCHLTSKGPRDSPVQTSAWTVVHAQDP